MIDTGQSGSGTEIRAVGGVRKLAALDTETVCAGHGDPIVTGGGARLRELAATLG